MKKYLFLCLVTVLWLTAGVPLCADSEEPDCGLGNGYLKRDVLLDENVRRRGCLEQDGLFEHRTRIYDEQGRRRGYMKRDPLSEDRSNIYLDEWD